MKDQVQWCLVGRFFPDAACAIIRPNIIDATTLALSVIAEAIGRGSPVIVGPSLNAPLLNHPEAHASLKKLPGWGEDRPAGRRG